MPTKYGHFTLVAFKEKISGGEHLALVKGTWEKDEAVLNAYTAVVLRAIF
jgi:3,4-dihydroxy 2-butanone 4-phosphate synthase/GTP cyclohydrolase II